MVVVGVGAASAGDVVEVEVVFEVAEVVLAEGDVVDVDFRHECVFSEAGQDGF